VGRAELNGVRMIWQVAALMLQGQGQSRNVCSAQATVMEYSVEQRVFLVNTYRVTGSIGTHNWNSGGSLEFARSQRNRLCNPWLRNYPRFNILDSVISPSSTQYSEMFRRREMKEKGDVLNYNGVSDVLRHICN
jgi:hypothetical protein